MDAVSEKWPKFQAELLRIMYEHDALVHFNKEQELAIRARQNQALADALFRHKRELDLMMGKSIDPITHIVTEPITLTVVGGLRR